MLVAGSVITIPTTLQPNNQSSHFVHTPSVVRVLAWSSQHQNLLATDGLEGVVLLEVVWMVQFGFGAYSHI